ncbi:MAG TPA: Crp/Fnr family transcriptional regulator [Ohtaekwangia sp.]|uniref:Crp/Fnr family transcriptional regulator n=1 Tax=Ohtaekwangia sp. TaxID=2066019 RepID=UPI002F93F98A
MNELEHYITSYFGIARHDLEAISSLFKLTALQKGDYYLKPGEVCGTLSFQRSGIIRVYIQDEDRETTQWISTKGQFISDLSGIIFNRPARASIQALTDCELYTISSQDYAGIGKRIPSWHELEKLFIARCFVFMEERIYTLLSMSTEARYRWLFDQQPELFNQVPLQYLASMLGMTPETLSRIRGKKIK